MTEHKIDGTTMWARWNAPFKDSGYQELMDRERNRERQRLERIRARRQQTMWMWVAALLLLTFCLAAWGGAFAVHAQNGYQIQQKIDDQWQVFRTPRGNYAQAQSETACQLDLASAASIMPGGTILACRRVRQPTPLQRNAQGD